MDACIAQVACTSERGTPEVMIWSGVAQVACGAEAAEVAACVAAARPTRIFLCMPQVRAPRVLTRHLRHTRCHARGVNNTLTETREVCTTHLRTPKRIGGPRASSSACPRSHVTEFIHQMVSESLPHKSSTCYLLLLISTIICRLYGGVVLLKPFNANML